ncbi:tRNA pseudouridine(38-40) synthase TruA [Thermocladium modestius]|nr:tRNA pseudouridine(38-40) synthase TruA [Thermocladium modestius]
MVVRMAYLVMYDGSAFNGFSGGRGSVEHVITRVLSRLNGSPVRLDKASRTDPGVSALMNVVAVNLNDELKTGLINSKLPRQVRVWGAARVPPSFNPRRAMQRTYLYFSPSMGEDLELMRRAAAAFVGRHDLRNYMIRDGSPTIVEMHEINVEEFNGIISVEFKGRGFRNKMLRKIMHAILMAGRGVLGVDFLRRTIDTEENIPMPPHQPHGLVLKAVKYENQPGFSIDKAALSYFTRYLRSRLAEINAMSASYELLLRGAMYEYWDGDLRP